MTTIQQQSNAFRSKSNFLKHDNFAVVTATIALKLLMKKISNDPIAFACAGPPEMKRLKDFPHNGCKEFGSKDVVEELPECDLSKFKIINIPDTLPPISRFAQPNIQGADEVGKICTCSNDGCNNPAGSGQPKPPSGDGTQSGVDPKPAPADNTDQKDKPSFVFHHSGQYYLRKSSK